MTTEVIPEPTLTPNPTPAPSGGEPNPNPAPPTPTLEERLKEVEEKYEASIKGMNEAQRRAAEREKEADMLRLQLAQTTTLAASQNRVPDPLAELDTRIQQLEDAGDFTNARKLERERGMLITQAVVTQNAQAQINQFANMVELNPTYSPETKTALKELLYRDGKPEYGPNPKMAQFLTQAAVTGTLTEILEMAENKAIGREVKSGDYDKKLTQKQKEAQMKADAEIKRQQSITGPTTGAPPATPTAEEKKKFEDDFTQKIINARRP